MSIRSMVHSLRRSRMNNWICGVPAADPVMGWRLRF